MRRDQLEHAIRAATQVVQQDAVIIIGSQSILGTWSEDRLPERATLSTEVDICPMDDDDAESLATLLDGVIGELSPFHESHGFYIQGVGRRTAILPDGWVERLVQVRNDNTSGRTGLCLEPHDLCAAKLLAGRDKDYEFVESLVQAHLVDLAVIHDRVMLTRTDTERTARARSWLEATIPPSAPEFLPPAPTVALRDPPWARKPV